MMFWAVDPKLAVVEMVVQQCTEMGCAVWTPTIKLAGLTHTLYRYDAHTVQMKDGAEQSLKHRLLFMLAQFMDGNLNRFRESGCLVCNIRTFVSKSDDVAS